MKNIADLSIIIPSLGEEVLLKTVNSILNNTLLPKEIIIVVPSNKIKNLDTLPINTSIIKVATKEVGQVKQRIVGLKKSTSNLIMQLDSDILLNTKTIEKFVSLMHIYKKNIAIAPRLRLPNAGTKNSKNYIKSIILNNLFNSKPGVILSFGYNTWFEEDKYPNQITEVEWLPGGCLFLFKNDIITDNYYPFSGSAICEDVIHSILLKKKNIKLLLNPNEIVINLTDSSNDGVTNLKLIEEFKKRYYLLTIRNGSRVIFCIWFLVYRLIRKLK